MISLEKRVEVYEAVLHRLQLCQVSGNEIAMQKLLERIWNWSYAHRSGNGELTDEEQQERIDTAFWALV
jgi:hypothetical protein